MGDYDGLTLREQLAAELADTPFRCDACSTAKTTVKQHDLPGGTRFRLCPRCATLHSAMPVREEVKA